MTNILDKLDPYFIEYNKIDSSGKYKIERIDARFLFNPKRIDLIAKYYYIECREKNQNVEFAKKLYMRHIEAFSDGTFSEHGNDKKNSLKAYVDTFDVMIDGIKTNGFDENISLIPIGSDDTLLDGSHRVACAAYFNQKITVVRFLDVHVNYGLTFFMKHLLDSSYLFFMAMNYIKMSSDGWLLLINQPGLHIIKQNYEVIYSSRVSCENKLNCLLEEAGINAKNLNCNKTIEVYFVEGPMSCLDSEIVMISADSNTHKIFEYLYLSYTKNNDKKILRKKIFFIKRRMRLLYRITLNMVKHILRMPK